MQELFSEVSEALRNTPINFSKLTQKTEKTNDLAATYDELNHNGPVNFRRDVERKVKNETLNERHFINAFGSAERFTQAMAYIEAMYEDDSVESALERAPDHHKPLIKIHDLYSQAVLSGMETPTIDNAVEQQAARGRDDGVIR